jgi:hypothetical protein
MNEAEWLICSEPDRMLEFMGGKASNRKLRLFVCGCCRSIWHLITPEASRERWKPENSGPMGLRIRTSARQLGAKPSRVCTNGGKNQGFRLRFSRY